MRIQPGWFLVAIGLLTSACSRPRSLSHEVYVWQRLWTAEVADAVAQMPKELSVLHVLAREWSGATASDAEVDVAALAASGRDVVAVMRIDGTGPIDHVRVDDLVARVRGWQSHGVRVSGVEIDYDCATARLPNYADWITRTRAALGSLPFGITALPTWIESATLPRLVAAVDYVVLQVHTVAAPMIFDARSARHHVEAWAAATRQRFRVALPTYRARLKDGRWVGAEPRVLSRFLADLVSHPVDGLERVVWFRLGHRADSNAWSAATLGAVWRGGDLEPHFTPQLVAAPSGAWDVVLKNSGLVDGEAPRRVAFSGQLDVLEGVRGFAADGQTLATVSPSWIRAGEAMVVGFVRGKDIDVSLP